MKNLNIVVIGNRLTEFSNNRNIFTYEQFCHLLESEAKLMGSQNEYFVRIGQGLNSEQRQAIGEKIEQFGLSARFVIGGQLAYLNRAHTKLTHKNKCENIMISDPEKLSETEFKSYLMLDENCAEMSDHITGQHIQGMVLIEAARQMINSVSEKYLIVDKKNFRKGFVLNSLNSTFLEYVFPLDVELILSIAKLRNGLGGNFKAEAIISIRQQNKEMLKVDIGFSVMDKGALLNIESQMAGQVVQRALGQEHLHLVRSFSAA